MGFLEQTSAFLLFFSAQVKVFVTGLSSLNQDIPAFKEHLRDFLVQIKVSDHRSWNPIQRPDEAVLCATYRVLVEQSLGLEAEDPDTLHGSPLGMGAVWTWSYPAPSQYHWNGSGA